MKLNKGTKLETLGIYGVQLTGIAIGLDTVVCISVRHSGGFDLGEVFRMRSMSRHTNGR
jgi:hypothetical protein